MRSWRRLSWTSICDQALSTWLRRLTRPLYPSQKNSRIRTTMTAITITAIMRSSYLGGPSNDGRARCGDGALVERQEALGEVRHGEFVGPAGALGDELGPSSGVVEERAQAGAEQVDVAGRDEQRLPIGTGHGPVPVDVGGDD